LYSSWILCKTFFPEVRFLATISIFCENFDFFPKFRFFPKILIFCQNSDFLPKFRFLDKTFFFKKFNFLKQTYIFINFGQNFFRPEVWFMTKCRLLTNFPSGQFWSKITFFGQFTKTSDKLFSTLLQDAPWNLFLGKMFMIVRMFM